MGEVDKVDEFTTWGIELLPRLLRTWRIQSRRGHWAISSVMKMLQAKSSAPSTFKAMESLMSAEWRKGCTSSLWTAFGAQPPDGGGG